MSRPIRIATLNVRGLNNINHRRVIFSTIRNLNIDLICLQELNMEPSNSQEYFRLSRIQLLESQSHDERILVALCRLDNRVNMAFCCVYAPANQTERRVFFNSSHLWDLGL